MIKSGEEVKAFRCPKCHRVIEIKSESKEYVTINGNLCWGDSVIFAGYFIDDLHQKKPCRICISCLIEILKSYLLFKDPYEGDGICNLDKRD